MAWSVALLVAAAACGGDSGRGVADGALLDAPHSDAVAEDATSIDAPVGCRPLALTTAPRVRRAIAVRSQEEFQIYAQRGDAFQKIFSAPGGAHITTVGWGDADGDGVDEVASGWFTLPASTGSGVQVFTDRGAGLTVRETFAGLPASLAWLRVDADTRDDLWFNDGSGHVMCSGATTLGWCLDDVELLNPAYSVGVGDPDADGDADLAIAASSELAAYHVTNGDLVERLRTQVPTFVRAMAWAEVDGCAGDDLLVLFNGNDGSVLRAYRWNGYTYAEFRVDPLPTTGPFWWTDIDGDGDSDPLICAGDGLDSGPALHLYRRDASGYQLVQTFGNLGCAAAFGDYDADGDVDLAYQALDGADSALVVARNDGGGFTESARLPGVEANALAWGRCGVDPTAPCFPSNPGIP